MELRQSTASQEISLGQFLDDADGNTEENGLTIANTDIKIRKGGGTTLINKTSGGATVISNGVYSAVLDATDTDTAGQLEVEVHAASGHPALQRVVLNPLHLLVSRDDFLGRQLALRGRVHRLGR